MDPLFASSPARTTPPWDAGSPAPSDAPLLHSAPAIRLDGALAHTLPLSTRSIAPLHSSSAPSRLHRSAEKPSPSPFAPPSSLRAIPFPPPRSVRFLTHGVSSGSYKDAPTIS